MLNRRSKYNHEFVGCLIDERRYTYRIEQKDGKNQTVSLGYNVKEIR